MPLSPGLSFRSWLKGKKHWLGPDTKGAGQGGSSNSSNCGNECTVLRVRPLGRLLGAISGSGRSSESTSRRRAPLCYQLWKYSLSTCVGSFFFSPAPVSADFRPRCLLARGFLQQAKTKDILIMNIASHCTKKKERRYKCCSETRHHGKMWLGMKRVMAGVWLP